MVRDFQSVIGKETRQQVMEKEGRLPDTIVACVGGGSNAIGIFYPFLNDDVELVGVEAGGKESRPANIPQRSAPVNRACCMGHSPISCRTVTGRYCPPTAYRQASITRA